MSISEVTFNIYRAEQLEITANSVTPHISPFIILCVMLHTLDYQHRKFLLDCARIQQNINTNTYFHDAFESLGPQASGVIHPNQYCML